MLLRARWILPVSSEPIPDGAIVVRDGIIVDVGPHPALADRHAAEPARDLGESILLPGLVNAHAHLELTLLRGLLEGLPFFPWIRRLVELKRGLDAEAYVHSSLLGAAEMIRAGTTTVADCSDTGVPLDALIRSGLRGIVFQEVFAPASSWLPDALSGLDERLDSLQARVTARVAAGVSPHSTFMACDGLLDAVARVASDRQLAVSIHVAESPAENDFIREGSGPIAEHHRSRGFDVAARGRSPVEHLAERGWLGLPVPTQLVHLAHASASDLDLVMAAVGAGARLGLAACPRSNANLGNGLPDLAGWTRRRLPWGLGTDGAPSVGACDLFSEMRAARLAWTTGSGASPCDARSLVSRCTLEAARSLGLEASIGSLEFGKQADLCAIRIDATRVLPGEDPHETLFRLATPGDVVLTMVAGDTIFDGHDVATLDEPRVAARCRETADALRTRPPAQERGRRPDS